MADGSRQLKFECRACGRQFAWRPSIAGKSAKCACGAMVKVPAKPPAGALEDPGNAYDIDVAPAGHADRCRACGQPLDAGAILCVACGFNQKTGKKMTTAIGGGSEDDDGGKTAPPLPSRNAIPEALPEPDLSNRFGGVVPGLRTPVFQEEPNPYKQFIKPAVLMVVLLALAGGAIFAFRGMSTSTAESQHPFDRQVTKMIDTSGGHELKEWLADNQRQQRMVQGMNEAQANGFADKLYKMGAVKVLAFGPLMTLQLGVELPSDPAKRAELFAFQKQWHESMAKPVQTDEGQKYMLLEMKVVR